MLLSCKKFPLKRYIQYKETKTVRTCTRHISRTNSLVFLLVSFFVLCINGKSTSRLSVKYEFHAMSINFGKLTVIDEPTHSYLSFEYSRFYREAFNFRTNTQDKMVLILDIWYVFGKLSIQYFTHQLNCLIYEDLDSMS